MKRTLLFTAFLLGVIIAFGCEPSEKSEKPSVVSGGSSHIIILKEGEEIRGTLLRIEKGKIYFRSAEGKDLVYAKSKVERIELPKIRKFNDITNIRDIKDALLKELIAKAPKQMGPAQYVTLSETDTLQIAKDGSWNRKKRVIAKVLLDRGKNQVGNQLFYYLAKQQECEIVYARTINPDGNVYNLEDKAVNDGSIYNSVPIYENQRQLKFALKKLQAGSVVDYEIEWRTKKGTPQYPLYLAEIFADTEPILSKTVRIIAPRSLLVPLSFDERRFQNSPPEITQADEGENHITTFTVKNIPAFRLQEYDIPPWWDFMPRLAVANSGSWADIIKTHQSLSNLGYLGEKLLNAETLKAHEKKAKELTKGLKTNKEKLAALYEFVARKLRSADVPLSSTDYVPHHPSLILTESRANSLDKCSLFVHMAKSLGMKADLLFVRSRDSGNVDPAAPSIRQFNGVIAGTEQGCVSFESNSYRFGQIPAHYEGSMALGMNLSKLSIPGVEPSAVPGLLSITMLAPERHLIERDYKIKLLADNSLHIVRKTVIHGEDEADYRGWRFQRKAAVDKIIASQVGAISPNAVLIKYSISKLDDYGIPVTIETEYKITNYAQPAGNLKLLKLPEMQGSAFVVAKPKRFLPIQRSKKRKSITRMSIETPKGFGVYFVPKSWQHKDNVLSYTATFKNGANKIDFVQEFSLNSEIIAPQDYPEYKKYVETQVELMNQWLILEKK